MPLSVFATITPKPEYFEAATQAIRDIVAVTRAEPGCRAFALHAGAEGGRLHLYEIWADRAAFDAHHAQPYTRRVFALFADWLAEPPALTFMEPLVAD